MNNSLASFEKSIAGILIGLVGLYWALDNYLPAVFYPELNNVRGALTAPVDPSPRKGRVIPAGVCGAYLADPGAFLSRDGFSGELPVSSSDATKINWFAKSTDGQVYPSNAYLVGFIPFRTRQYWLPLLAVSLRVRYTRDDEITVNEDIWQTGPETYLRMAGDCEDHAILLADWMTSLGYDTRVVVGLFQGELHAWVELFKDGKEYLLEATDKSSRRRYPLVAFHPEYVPIFMFDREHFWGAVTEKKGWRNRSSTQGWIKLSDFEERLF
ncbi:MAG TPA: transglutaminase domain-containing protein [Candidatus Omnitrophota bacterium]|nr:transglutaminase domain-containing protein [Candidatus Omnitrophota bacterium]